MAAVSPVAVYFVAVEEVAPRPEGENPNQIAWRGLRTIPIWRLRWAVQSAVQELGHRPRYISRSIMSVLYLPYAAVCVAIWK